MMNERTNNTDIMPEKAYIAYQFDNEEPEVGRKFHCTRICLFGRTEKSTGHDHIQALSGNPRYASSETGSWGNHVPY